MKRPWLILICGLLLAALAYGGSYLALSARAHRMEQSDTPELSWLKSEFQVSDAEFDRVQKLYDSYTSGCMERCREIDNHNNRLQALLSETNVITPEIEQELHEAARLRAECQKAMLDHCYAISRSMPPDQGKRYLEWMHQCIFGSEHPSMIRSPQDAHGQHHHE